MTAEELKAYFAEKKISMAELSRFLECDYRTVQRWFRGDYKVPKLLQLAVNADVFDTQEVQRVVLRKRGQLQ
jgi:hypothetical protein